MKTGPAFPINRGASVSCTGTLVKLCNYDFINRHATFHYLLQTGKDCCITVLKKSNCILRTCNTNLTCDEIALKVIPAFGVPNYGGMTL
jgi:hypothetical protein